MHTERSFLTLQWQRQHQSVARVVATRTIAANHVDHGILGAGKRPVNRTRVARPTALKFKVDMNNASRGWEQADGAQQLAPFDALASPHEDSRQVQISSSVAGVVLKYDFEPDT